MNGVFSNITEILGGRYIISKTRNGNGFTSVVQILPNTKKSDEIISLESFVKNLRNEIHITNQSSLEDNGSTRSIKQFNWEMSLVSFLFRIANG